jgi:hypothetical protein
MDAGLLDLLIDTVTIRPWASQNSSGEATFGSAVSYSALVEYDTQKVEVVGTIDGRGGSALVSKALVYLDGRPSIDLKDKITLPDGSTPQIIAVRSYSDQAGGYTTEVQC